jgi:hypothetical protein
MPRQGLDTRCAPVQPCEHRPLEIHASTPPGIAPSCCILLSLPGRHAARKSTIAQTLDDGAVPEPALHSPRRHSDHTRGQSAGSGWATSASVDIGTLAQPRDRIGDLSPPPRRQTGSPESTATESRTHT